MLGTRPLLVVLLTCLLALIPASARADMEVEVTASGFLPAQLTVDAGETLHFVNRTGKTWSVKDDDGLFDSGVLEPDPLRGGHR